MPAETRAIAGVDDSKRLTHDQRVRLSGIIRQRAVAFAIGAASVHEIDRINIYQASALAMQRALGRLSVTPDHVVIDGRVMRTLPVPHTAVVRGDVRCFSIACASILAKVHRDHMISQWDPVFPAYGLRSNKGYSTPKHLVALREHGPSPLHRQSFAPVWNAPVPQTVLQFMLQDSGSSTEQTA